MVEGDKAEVPAGRGKGLATGSHLRQHEDLVNIQQNPGEMTYQKKEHYTKQNGRQIHFRSSLFVLLFHALVRHLNTAKNTEIEVNQGRHGNDTGGDQSRPIDVKLDVIGVVT